MNLTLHEKRTIYQILVLIMEADSIVREEEVSYLNKLFVDFGLSLDEFDHMEAMDLDQLKAEFSNWDDEHRSYAKSLFLGIAKSDGYYDSRERMLIDLF